MRVYYQILPVEMQYVGKYILNMANLTWKDYSNVCHNTGSWILCIYDKSKNELSTLGLKFLRWSNIAVQELSTAMCCMELSGLRWKVFVLISHQISSKDNVFKVI